MTVNIGNNFGSQRKVYELLE